MQLGTTNQARSSHKKNARVLKVAVCALLATVMVTQVGCMLFANVMHAVGADKTPAKYDGLEDSKVAIVTIGEGSQYSDDISARLLSRKLSEILLTEVDDLTLVREDKIDQWRDQNGWDTIDFAAIGKAVDADKVLAIELANLQLRDGSTTYRGQADVNIMVLDPSSGDVLYQKQVDEFQYPVSAGQPITETTERRFRKLYMTMLAKHIGRHFHPFDASELFALDGKMASQ